MADKTSTRILVWDIPVRFFHWTLVLLLLVSYFTARAGGDWMKLHFWSGYAILTLLFFRFAWGFFGSTTARFSNFLKGPSAAFHHLADLLGRGRPRDAGHNPMGGAMVVVLILAVLAQAVTGLFSADTDMGTVNGPLALKVADKWVERATAFHSFWINVLIILAGLHVLAVLFYLAWKRQNSDRRHVHRPQAGRRCGRARRGSAQARLRVEPPRDIAASGLGSVGLFYRSRRWLICGAGRSVRTGG